MTPEKAIQLLDSVTAQVPLTRPQHNQVLEALDMLRVMVEAGNKEGNKPV